jgi:hypothetical protein
MKKSFIITTVCAIGLALASTAFAAATVTISPVLPGSLSGVGSAGPGAFVKNFYQYALFISGILAFGAIVYGGIRYAWARGNPSGETEAKAWIWSALLGLLLLAGAYLILFTVNPNLVNLSLPTLPTAPAVSPGTISGGGITSGRSFSPGLGGNAATNAISASAISYFGTNTSGGPGNGTVSCAWAVNNVLAQAGIAPLDSNSVQSMENALTSGRGTQVDPSQAQPGDIVIQAQDGHVGVCMNVGCTQVLSNSSSNASFSWVSDTSFSPSYSGGPGRIYQVNH